MDLVLAGVSVRLVLRTGSEQLLPALRRLFSHAERELAEADIVVELAGASAVDSPSAKPTFGFAADRPILGWLTDGADGLLLSDDRTLAAVDYLRGRATFHLSDSGEAATFVACHRLLPIALSELLKSRGVYYLHAAALASSTGLGLLLLGDSEAGKSTTTYRGIQLGWSYVADDGVLLRASSSGVEVHAFYREFNLHPDLLQDEHVPFVREVEPTASGPRLSLDWTQLPSVASAPVRGVAILRRPPRATSAYSPASSADTLGALLRQNALVPLHPGLAGQHLALLARLTRDPVKGILTLGHDILEERQLASSLLSRSVHGA